MSDKNETLIEAHFIGGHGPLLQFIESSKTFASWGWSEREHIEKLTKAASFEDKNAREFALSLIAKIDSMQQDGDELRKRIDTIGRAIERINESIKSA
jgi:hypothetical protein